uniref:Mobile element protein n=1 Tax=Ascaris lumbricoides TaxID=6252 RepID=A0A0M3HL53_ASCLU
MISAEILLQLFADCFLPESRHSKVKLPTAQQSRHRFLHPHP